MARDGAVIGSDRRGGGQPNRPSMHWWEIWMKLIAVGQRDLYWKDCCVLSTNIIEWAVWQGIVTAGGKEVCLSTMQETTLYFVTTALRKESPDNPTKVETMSSIHYQIDMGPYCVCNVCLAADPIPKQALHSCHWYWWE